MKDLTERLAWLADEISDELFDDEYIGDLREGIARIKKLEADMRIADRNAYYAAVKKVEAGYPFANIDAEALIERLRDVAGTDDNFLLYDSAAEIYSLLEENKKLKAALRWVHEVQPGLSDTRGAEVQMTWHEWRLMCEAMGKKFHAPKHADLGEPKP